MFSEHAEYTSFLNFFIYIHSRLPCGCPFDTVGGGVQSAHNVSFLQQSSTEALVTSSLPQSLLAETLSVSVPLSLALPLILSPITLFELGFSTLRLSKLQQTEYTNVLYRMQFSLLGLYLLQIAEFR